MTYPPIAETICGSLRLYGLAPVIMPPRGDGSPFVTIKCGERISTFNPADAPKSMTAQIEWMHDRMRELLPEGWAPPPALTKETA